MSATKIALIQRCAMRRRRLLDVIEGERAVSRECHLEGGGEETAVGDVVASAERAGLEEGLRGSEGGGEQLRPLDVRRRLANLLVHLRG